MKKCHSIKFFKNGVLLESHPLYGKTRPLDRDFIVDALAIDDEIDFDTEWYFVDDLIEGEAIEYIMPLEYNVDDFDDNIVDINICRDYEQKIFNSHSRNSTETVQGLLCNTWKYKQVKL